MPLSKEMTETRKQVMELTFGKMWEYKYASMAKSLGWLLCFRSPFDMWLGKNWQIIQLESFHHEKKNGTGIES